MAFQKTIIKKKIHVNVHSYFKLTNLYGTVSMCHVHRWLSHVPDLMGLSATILFVCHFRIYEIFTHTWSPQRSDHLVTVPFKCAKQSQVDEEKKSEEIKWLGQAYMANES